MLALAVGVYLVLLVGSFAALGRSLWAPLSPLGRHKLAVGLLVAAETGYMLWAPACVYLPKAPGAPAIKRQLVGRDDAGTLYWLESKHPVAFAWGPRWWLAVGGHLIDGGLEIVPPLRYARPEAASAEVVSSDGRRWPVPADTSRRKFLVVGHDGTLLAWDFKGLYRLSEGPETWQELVKWPVVKWPDSSGGWLQAVVSLPGRGLLEVRELGDVGKESHGRERGLLFVERNLDGTEARRTSLVVPERKPTRRGEPGRHVAVQGLTDGLILFIIRGHSGDVYRLDSDFAVVESGATFDKDPSASLALAASPTGQLFTTGRAVFRISGEKLLELDPLLHSCVWSDDRLGGVEEYPLFAALVEKRSVRFNLEAVPLQHDTEAKTRSAWVRGGFDEAGREDRIQEVTLP